MLGVARTAVIYHVRCLVKAGVVRQVRHGRRVLHFGAGKRDPLQDTLMGKLRQDRARQVLRTLLEEPTLAWRKLASRLDVTPRTVRWHVRRLEDEGLIQIQAAGGGHHVHVHPDVAKHLDDGPPGPPAASDGVEWA